MNRSRLHFLQGSTGIEGMFNLVDNVVCTEVVTLALEVLLMLNIREILNVWLQLLE